MTDSARILVDTNVLLDVTEADAQWRNWSQEQMAHYFGQLFVNPIIYTELCYEAGKVEEVDAVLLTLGLQGVQRGPSTFSCFFRRAIHRLSLIVGYAPDSLFPRNARRVAPLRDSKHFPAPSYFAGLEQDHEKSATG